MKFIYDNFDLLFDKAGSVEAFKKLILEMAVRGKLVSQDLNDEPACILIERITKEKERLIKKGVLKKEKLLPPVREDEMPFALPDSWEWSRLGIIATYGHCSSINPDTIDKSAWILELEDIEKNSSKLLKRIYLHERNSKSTKNYFNKGDVLYGKLRPYLNKVIVADQDGYSSSEIVPIKTYDSLLPKYIMFSLRQKHFFDYVNSCTYGTKMPRLGTEDAKKALISIPPLEEQKRIVKKIDEVFDMIPKFQEALEQRGNYKSKLNQTSLNRMTNTSTRDEFVKSVQFVLSNFDSLYDTTENIKELRQTILTLAVQGKLVPQDPSDEPASVLFEKIKKEKERLIMEGVIKREERQLESVAIEENKNTPSGWGNIKIKDVAQFIDYRGKTPRKVLHGIQLITAKNIKWGYIELEPKEYIAESEYERWMTRGIPSINDVVITTEAPLVP